LTEDLRPPYDSLPWISVAGFEDCATAACSAMVVGQIARRGPRGIFRSPSTTAITH